MFLLQALEYTCSFLPVLNRAPSIIQQGSFSSPTSYCMKLIWASNFELLVLRPGTLHWVFPPAMPLRPSFYARHNLSFLCEFLLPPRASFTGASPELHLLATPSSSSSHSSSSPLPLSRQTTPRHSTRSPAYLGNLSCLTNSQNKHSFSVSSSAPRRHLRVHHTPLILSYCRNRCRKIPDHTPSPFLLEPARLLCLQDTKTTSILRCERHACFAY